jgi:hypothetical protein
VDVMMLPLDPLLLSFLDSVEHELATELEIRHLQRDAAHDRDHDDESLATSNHAVRIAALSSVLDVLQAAFESGAVLSVH